MIPSWSDRHPTASSLGQKHRLPFEYLAMYETNALPSLPDATGRYPDAASYNMIQSQQALMGITDDQSTKSHALLYALRDTARERYGLGRVADGLESPLDRMDVFLDEMLGNATNSSPSSSSTSFFSSRTFNSGEHSPSIISAVLALIRDSVLGYRVNAR
ncbi:hypothetical protein Slin15195_G130330 [Septoria linicola]|uniref:Uncharacterized protein n=1 Tax=Septoria linicola TaxID=215465 RepID=A0A9Q9ERB2_9PEZI|nr:hypothetical protein Slin15195_G130330 [Septoria linicola]